MKDLRRVFGASGIMAFAMVLALAGCGGSGASDGASSDSSAATEEEVVDLATQKRAEDKAKAEEAKHWVVTEATTSNAFTYFSTDMEGNRTTGNGTSNTTTTYELDDYGNVIKKTEISTDDWGDSTSESESTIVYTRDDNGWPTKIETSESRKTTYDDGTGQMVEQDDGTETTEVTYTYEYDDEGRVVKAISSDEQAASVEFSYHENGEIATYTNTSGYMRYDEEGNAHLVHSTQVEEYAEDGTLVGRTTSNEAQEGAKSSTSEATFDADGSMAKSVTTYVYDDDTEGTETRTYTNERNEDGFVVKCTVTIEGDGKHVNRRWTNSNIMFDEVFMADGSIQATEVTRNDSFEETEGETKTYDGPYYVIEQEFDEQGNMKSETWTYYDGSVQTAEYTYDENGNGTKDVWTDSNGSTQTYTTTYDEHGNRTSSEVTSSEDDGSEYKTTYSYTYIEDPSEYQMKYKKDYSWIE